ncbi:hypothetical protein ACFQZ4_06110 [Catellatospora coxensis]
MAATRTPQPSTADQVEAERLPAANRDAANPDAESPDAESPDRLLSRDPWTSPFTSAHVVPAVSTPAATGRFRPGQVGPAGVSAADEAGTSAATAPWPRLTGRERGQEQEAGPWPELLDDTELWAVPAPTRTDPDRIRLRQSQQEGRPWNA